MADDNKKGGGKPGGKPADKPAPPSINPLEIIIGIVVVLAVGGAILANLGNYLRNNDLSFYGISLKGVFVSLRNHVWVFKIISYILSLAAAVGIVVFSRRKGKILMEEKQQLFPKGEPKTDKPNIVENNPLKDKWKEILLDVESVDESKWRMAIIEADIILEDFLRTLKLPGDTIGDKLKAVEPSDFLSLDAAWEAHKVRNNIAHGGSNFFLSQREARRIIMLYEQVFKEFFLI